MHILIIHQMFTSGRETGGTRHYELSRHLIRQGHEVSVMASTVTYQTGETTMPHREDLDGINVQRTWTYSAVHRSFLSRIISFLSFMLSSFWRGCRIGKVDLVWGTSPPIFQGITAYLLARIKGVPFVFEVRDLWPDFAIEIGVLTNPFLIRVSKWLERFLYPHADHLIVNSPGFLPHLAEFDIPLSSTSLVTNGVETSMFDPDDRGLDIRREWGLEGNFVVLYAGAHGLANDLGTVLDAAGLLNGYPDIRIVLVGVG